MIGNRRTEWSFFLVYGVIKFKSLFLQHCYMSLGRLHVERGEVRTRIEGMNYACDIQRGAQFEESVTRCTILDSSGR